MEDSCEQVLEEKDKAQFSFATSSWNSLLWLEKKLLHKYKQN
jgi:hypothetical protein